IPPQEKTVITEIVIGYHFIFLIFRALINIFPLPATFSKLFPDFLACFEIKVYLCGRFTESKLIIYG
ncbi:hypothetical protein DWW35_15835, partial [Segatella copri]